MGNKTVHVTVFGLQNSGRIESCIAFLQRAHAPGLYSNETVFDPSFESSFSTTIQNQVGQFEMVLEDMCMDNEYGSLADPTIRKSDAFYVMYEQDSEESFKYAEKICKRIMRIREDDTGYSDIVLVANRKDHFQCDDFMWALTSIGGELRNDFLRAFGGDANLAGEALSFLTDTKFHRDLSSLACVSREDGQALARKLGVHYMETIASSREGVARAFETCLNLYVNRNSQEAVTPAGPDASVLRRMGRSTRRLFSAMSTYMLA